MKTMEVVMACPVCGQEVDREILHKLGLEGEVLQEVQALRDEGKLTQAIFLAIKIVRTVQDNPQWMKDLLEEQTRILSVGIKDTVPTDSFSTENSTRKGEDVECSVIEENDLAGTIIIESKRVKTWSSAHVDQVKEYMAKRGTPFGIVATSAMPSDALSDSLIIDGVLI